LIRFDISRCYEVATHFEVMNEGAA